MTEANARKKRRLNPAEQAPFVLHKVLDDIPLDSDDHGSPGPVSITCVEFWNNNLYIGTSASEILHLVCLPPEHESEPPQYILATRLQPSGHETVPPSSPAGVQQILVLPGPAKAVVLCNGTASFYALPELSPAFPNRKPVTGVHWIGGYDENEGRDDPDGTAIMMALPRSLQRVLVGEKLQAIKPPISYPDCHDARRRDTIACVADRKGYALLEIEHQQKIPLFDVSTDPAPVSPEKSDHLSAPSPAHGRSKSLGDFSPSISPGLSPADAQRSGSTESEVPPASREQVERSPNRPRASTTETNSTPTVQIHPSSEPLQPHVLSPSPNEFMLTTGTTWSEPGVGMFVNLDGDVSRSTIEFDQYPRALLSYSFLDTIDPSAEDAGDELILAMLEKPRSGVYVCGIQINILNGPAADTVHWLQLSESSASASIPFAGLHRSLTAQDHKFTKVAELLQAVRYSFSASAIAQGQRRNDTTNTSREEDLKRSVEEAAFVQRFGSTTTNALVWSQGNLWHLLRNPLLLQLEAQLLKSISITHEDLDFSRVDVPQVLSFLGGIREREPQDETEFISLKYARQKASVVLFLHLLAGIKSNKNLRAACQISESALHEGEIDPRIVLSLLRPLVSEVISGLAGIWLHQGIVDLLEEFQSPIASFEDAPMEFWLMLRHFLSTWQEKRGFGSISDEKSVFDTVDAALLHLLLHLDKVLSNSDGTQAPTRAKLSNIVDHWKGDFDKAVALLEEHQRLYLLSRLYQSKRAAKDVLHTWKRICEGEPNADTDVSIETVLETMRKYLTAIRDANLVQTYCVWLAQRTPELAIQVLSDENSRVKFAPAEVVTLLKENAPGAVQLFLEHLVFAKNLDQYADDLVGYYLDSVLDVLENSEDARQSLAESYTTYRALTSPKPTYLHFIQQNAPEESWWQSRLRLLQLLGSGGYAAAGSSKTLTYSIETVLDRLKPFSQYLVSESVILDARQGRHNEALQLLVHGLGDYDTAVRYCYFGGPTSPTGTIDVSMLPPRAQQEQQFNFLFGEFLLIEDMDERLDRTSHLLGTFATWFDPLSVLQNIPDSWSVSTLSDFLLRTLRAATSARNQSVIVKALSAAQNLQKQAEFIEVCEKFGAQVESAEENQTHGKDVVAVEG